MTTDPGWVTADDLIALNRLLVEDTGEPFRLLDRGLLEQSVFSPANVAYYEQEQDIVVLGCTLALSVARNHCFQQGNKRTAQAALFRFLWINGYTFVDPDDLRLADLLIAVVAREITPDQYIAAIDGHVIERA